MRLSSARQGLAAVGENVAAHSATLRQAQKADSELTALLDADEKSADAVTRPRSPRSRKLRKRKLRKTPSPSPSAPASDEEWVPTGSSAGTLWLTAVLPLVQAPTLVPNRAVPPHRTPLECRNRLLRPRRPRWPVLLIRRSRGGPSTCPNTRGWARSRIQPNGWIRDAVFVVMANNPLHPPYNINDSANQDEVVALAGRALVCIESLGIGGTVHTVGAALRYLRGCDLANTLADRHLKEVRYRQGLLHDLFHLINCFAGSSTAGSVRTLPRIGDRPIRDWHARPLWVPTSGSKSIEPNTPAREAVAEAAHRVEVKATEVAAVAEVVAGAAVTAATATAKVAVTAVTTGAAVTASAVAAVIEVVAVADAKAVATRVPTPALTTVSARIIRPRVANANPDTAPAPAPRNESQSNLLVPVPPSRAPRAMLAPVRPPQRHHRYPRRPNSLLYGTQMMTCKTPRCSSTGTKTPAAVEPFGRKPALTNTVKATAVTRSANASTTSSRMSMRGKPLCL